MIMSTRIHFNKVVPRDGFQMEPAFVATDCKIALNQANLRMRRE